MNCRRAAPLLNAYVDGELAASVEQEVSSHLTECAACTHQVTDLQALHEALSTDSMYHHAPGTLRSRLEQVVASNTSVSVLFQPVTPKSLATVLFGIVLLAGLSASAWWWWTSQPAVTLADLTVRSHVLAVRENRQTEVTSSNPQVVAAWLQANTGHAITVRDLTAQKYTLTGARLELTSLGTIPVLVYVNSGQAVDLYHWPNYCERQKRSCLYLRQGYHLLNWYDAGTAYWAVSELSGECLQEFAGSVLNKSTGSK